MANEKLWERGERETARAFAAFQLFRDMGSERTQLGVAAKLGCSRHNIDRFAARWHWTERARAYDNYLDQLALQKEEAARLEMYERHRKLAMAVLVKAAEKLKKLNPDDLEVRDVVDWLRTGTDLERKTRGEPEQGAGVAVNFIIETTE